jgi:hypothetical protein
MEMLQGSFTRLISEANFALSYAFLFIQYFYPLFKTCKLIAKSDLWLLLEI